MQLPRLRPVALAVLLLGTPPVVDSQVLSSVETADLRLLYFDPTETYLVPRVIQTFHASLERQQSILGYESTAKTTILLKDFSDYGNAGASAVPWNTVIVDIAPIPLTLAFSGSYDYGANADYGLFGDARMRGLGFRMSVGVRF